MSTQSEKLTAIANAIRAKEGSTGGIVANDFPARIAAIQTGVDTSDATAAAGDILSGKTAYVNEQKLTGTIPSKTSADLSIHEVTGSMGITNAQVSVPTGFYPAGISKNIPKGGIVSPSITVSSNGLITATETATAGYIVSDENVASATKQLTTQAAKSWTPTTSNQTIAANTFLTGTQTIKGDSNLVASNIKEGVSIFGITGTATPLSGFVFGIQSLCNFAITAKVTTSHKGSTDYSVYNQYEFVSSSYSGFYTYKFGVLILKSNSLFYFDKPISNWGRIIEGTPSSSSSSFRSLTAMILEEAEIKIYPS